MLNGIYQVKKAEDYTKIWRLGFNTLIADHGQEMDLIKNTTLKFLVQINPEWDFQKTVIEFDPYPQVSGWVLPDEPNMDPHMTPGLMKLTVDKIKKHSKKPVFVCIANVNHARDYADWRRCGADVLMADIYPFKADPKHWYRRSWERGDWFGKLFRKFYAGWRVFEDSFRMRKAVAANYPQGTIAVLQAFGGKENSGSDRKFYLPNEKELTMLIRVWKKLGVERFFTFVWSSTLHDNISENRNLGAIITREIEKGEMK